MKLGMMDVGIFCKEPRNGISTEKGTVTVLQKHSSQQLISCIYLSLLMCFVVVVVVYHLLFLQTAASPSS